MSARRVDALVVRDRLLLIAVIGATTAFVWIRTVPIALGAFAVAVIALAAARKLTSRLVLFILWTTMFLYFLGNWLFSPAEAGGLAFGPLRINAAGVYRGAAASLKRGAMIGVSLAWIMSTPLPRLYNALAFLPGRWWLALFLRNLQIIRRDILLARASLLIRSRSARISRATLRITQLRLAIQSAVLRAFGTIPRLTYSAEVTRTEGRATDCSLELVDVSVRYAGGSPVLEHVNLRIEAGELVYVDGLSQSGRTTLLRVLAGYIPKITGEVAGDILLNGYSMRTLRLREIARSVRYVPTEADRSLLGLTVGGEISLYAADEAGAKEKLREMGLLQLWDQETSSLSGGEQVRLLIAGILAAPPPLVIFDAPLEQLDAEGRSDFLWALDALRVNKKLTVVIADNQRDELRNVASRVLVVEHCAVTEHAGIRERPNEAFDPPLVGENAGAIVAAMKNVSVVLGNRRILNSVSFEIHTGECVAITGPNGSGKTTAMLALAGVLPIESGAIEVHGLVGYVFQDPAAQLVEVLVRDELLVEPRFARWDTDRCDLFLHDALEWSAAREEAWTIDLHPQTARFVSIAEMAPEKSVLAFDEPSIGLDDAGVARLLARLADLQRAGIAMFVVTHDERIARFAQRAIRFTSGSVIDTTYGSATAGTPKFTEVKQHVS